MAKPKVKRKAYPSDVSKEQFERIEALLDSARKHTKPRELELYDLFCGVLYVLKSGCSWRMLPADFPKWRSVHAYWAKWSEPGPDGTSLLEQALKKSGERGPHRTQAQRANQLHHRG